MSFFRKLFKKDELKEAYKELDKILILQKKLKETAGKYGRVNEEIQTNNKILVNNAGIVDKIIHNNKPSIFNDSTSFERLNVSTPNVYNYPSTHGLFSHLYGDKVRETPKFDIIDLYINTEYKTALIDLEVKFLKLLKMKKLKSKVADILEVKIIEKLTKIIVKYAMDMDNTDNVVAFCLAKDLSATQIRDRFYVVLNIDEENEYNDDDYYFHFIDYKDLYVCDITEDNYTKEELSAYMESLSTLNKDFMIMTESKGEK